MPTIETYKLPFIAVLLFLFIYYTVVTSKPSVLFYEDGTIREFGVGYKNKTIFPIWLISIVLGIWCYLMILYLHYIK